MSNEHKRLRKRLLDWHYKKAETTSILDLLEGGYQKFRRDVGKRVGDENIGFRDALKLANQNELEYLQYFRDEERIDKQLNRRK